MTEPQPPQPHHASEAVTLWAGDCLDVMRTMPDASVDAVVTDPPYLLGFMGKAWDTKAAHEHLTFHGAWAAEAMRLLRPGGHLLAFGGTRTAHRLACAIEDAGFVIRDSIAWLYGSGFPKSLDVSKAIDARATVNDETRRRIALVAEVIRAHREAKGLERAAVSQAVVGTPSGACWNWEHQQLPSAALWPTIKRTLGIPDDYDGLISGDRAQFIAAERAVISTRRMGRLAVAPGQGEDRTARDLDLTAPATPDAQRWQGWGTALKPAHEPIVVARKPLTGTVAANVLAHGTGAINVDGCRIGERWPANVVLDEDQAAALDDQAAEVSRFYYVAKASRTERPRVNGVAHPTVKPLTLMRWLVRLVTPPGGIVLDPFTGSGTTVEACLAEGLRCVGIEADPDYLPLVLARIDRHTEPPTARAGTPRQVGASTPPQG